MILSSKLMFLSCSTLLFEIHVSNITGGTSPSNPTVQSEHLFGNYNQYDQQNQNSDQNSMQNQTETETNGTILVCKRALEWLDSHVELAEEKDNTADFLDELRRGGR